MVISHNLLALNAQRQFNITGTQKKKSTEKLASGYKINRAADDAAGLAISEKMRRQIRGLDQGARNTQDGISLLQVADGALNEVHDMLHRMSELSIQAANGTNSDSDREAIQQEISQIKSEIDRISDTTEFNTRKLFVGGENDSSNATNDGLYSEIKVQVSGVSTDNNAATYTITANKDTGIEINGESFAWNSLINDSDDTEDINGTIKINYHGMSFAIDVSHQNLESISNRLNGLSCKTEKIDSDNNAVRISQDVDEASFILASFQELTSIDLVASDRGLGVKYNGNEIDGPTWDLLYGSNTITSTWDDIGIDKDNIVAGSYIYKDERSGFNYTFSIGEGATINDIIQSLNGVRVNVEGVIISDWGFQSTGSKNIGYGGWLQPYESKVNDGKYLSSSEGIIYLNENDYSPSMNSDQYHNFSIGATGTYQLTLSDGRPAIEYIGVYSGERALAPISNGVVFKITDESWDKLRNFDYSKDYPYQYDVFNAVYLDVSEDRIITFESDNGSTFLAYLANKTTLDPTHAPDYEFDTTKRSYENVYKYFDGSKTDYSAFCLREAFRTCKYDLGTIVANTIEGETRYGINKTLLNEKKKINNNSTEVEAEEENDLKLWIQSGAEVGDGMFIVIGSMNSQILGVKDLDVSSYENAGKSIDAVSKATEIISELRSSIGAQQNRLEHTYKNVTNTAENTQAAESRIRDTDMAKEMVELSKHNILEQVGTSMIAQANQSNQGVLSLLQ